MRNKLLVYILSCSFLFQSVILIPDVSAIEIPKPYIYTYPPPNSFGMNVFKEVNWSYFKQLFNAHTSWLLEYKRYSTSGWTNGNQYLSINKTWMDDGYWKFGLRLNVPVDVYCARFTFACDLSVLDYIDKGENQIYLNYSIPNTNEYYNCTFDYSDLINIPDIVFTKGKTDNKFWFRFQKDNIKVGNYYFDPTFGYTGDTANIDIVTVGNTEYLYAGASLPAYGGWATSVTIKTGTTLAAACNLHCALYFYNNNSLLAQTETKSVSATSTIYTFNFTGNVVMPCTNYYIAVAPANDYSDAKQRTIRRGSSATQYYKSGVNGANFPNPISGLSTTSSAAPYIYCTYTTNTRQTTYSETLANSINHDYLNADVSIRIFDSEGNNLTVRQVLQDFYTSAELYTSPKVGTHNATIHINTSWLEGNRYYRWILYDSDTFYPSEYARSVYFATRPNITMYENIIDAAGVHQSQYNNYTGFKVWANYTGNAGGSSGSSFKNLSSNMIVCNLSANYSINYTINVSFLMNVSVGTFNYSVNCSNGQNFSAFNKGNDTYSFILSGLDYNLSYCIWVNLSSATQGYDNSTYTVNLSFNASSSANLILTVNRDRFTLGLVIGSFSFILMGYVLYRRKRKS